MIREMVAGRGKILAAACAIGLLAMIILFYHGGAETSLTSSPAFKQFGLQVKQPAAAVAPTQKQTVSAVRKPSASYTLSIVETSDKTCLSFAVFRDGQQVGTVKDIEGSGNGKQSVHGKVLALTLNDYCAACGLIRPNMRCIEVYLESVLGPITPIGTYLEKVDDSRGLISCCFRDRNDAPIAFSQSSTKVDDREITMFSGTGNGGARRSDEKPFLLRLTNKSQRFVRQSWEVLVQKEWVIDERLLMMAGVLKVCQQDL